MGDIEQREANLGTHDDDRTYRLIRGTQPKLSPGEVVEVDVAMRGMVSERAGRLIDKAPVCLVNTLVDELALRAVRISNDCGGAAKFKRSDTAVRHCGGVPNFAATAAGRVDGPTGQIAALHMQIGQKQAGVIRSSNRTIRRPTVARFLRADPDMVNLKVGRSPSV